jgi:hypothetical protein
MPVRSMRPILTASVSRPIGVGSDENLIRTAVAAVGRLLDQDHGMRSCGLVEAFRKHVCHAVHDFFLLSF